MSENNFDKPAFTSDELRLRRKALKLTQEQLAKKLGVSKRTIINYEGGETIPKSKAAILHQFLFGDVDPIPIEVKEPFEQFAIPSKNGHQTFNMPDGSFIMKVPLVPIKAYARYISEGDSAEFFEGGQEFAYFIVDHVAKGEYAAFQIKGDSFWNEGGYDTPDKAIALGRKLDKQHWRDGFRDSIYGWIIITHGNIVLKDIIDQDLENGKIVCHSRNPSPEYSDFKLLLDEDVKSIWRVIKRQF